MEGRERGRVVGVPKTEDTLVRNVGALKMYFGTPVVRLTP